MPRRTRQKQITMDYGRVRLWGSIAFVIGSALVGKLVSLYDYRAILALLSIGIASMLLGMLLRPSVMPQGKVAIRRARAGPHGGARSHRAGVFWRACASFRGTCGVLWFQRHLLAGAGYSASAVGYLWSLGVVAEVIIFALSKNCSAALARVTCCCFPPCAAWRAGDYGLDDRSAVADCGANSSLRHLYRVPSGGHALYRSARGRGRDSPAGRLFGSGNGGSIAIMTVFAGFLYQHLGHGVFWVMALVALPAIVVRPKVAARA